MKRFSQRSGQIELIDEPGIPFSDWEVCLHELNIVNTYLGGHSITIEGVRKLLPLKNEISILEIGCGGGDNLRAIDRWHKKNARSNTKFHFIGVDINKACTDYAEKNCKGVDAKFICCDYRDVSFNGNKPDIIFNSLFCHHFSDHELVEMLVWMKQNSSAGFFINDLQRHAVAYHSIKFLTHLFSRSYLIKNDAPISVSRGFLKDEWKSLLRRAGINKFDIRWRWAFRYLVSCTE
jgi:SAM-dependent methyltransferase